MDANFRFTLDDFVPVQDEPIGWEGAKIVIKRNDDFGGLFIEYVSELGFWGDGFQYIKSQIDAIGYCFTVKVSIEYQCTSDSAYENVFTGYANISRSLVDNEKCTIKTMLEVDNIYADFLNSADRQIFLSAAPIEFPNGNIATPNYRTISYHNVEDGTNALDDPTDNRMLAVNTIDALNYISSMITEGELPVVSEFFSSTQPKINIWRVELAGPTMKTGDVIFLTYKNMWGYSKTINIPYFGSEIITLTQLALACGDVSDLTGARGPATFCNYLLHFGFAYGEIDPTNSRRLLMYSWLPITITSVVITGTAPVTAVSYSETQPYQAGGAGLCISTQLNETFNAKIWNFQSLTSAKLSFRQLWNELSALFNVGMQLEGVPGAYVLRVEPMDYFYLLDSQIRIENVRDIKTTFDYGANYKQINMVSGAGSMGSIKFPQLFTPDGAMAAASNTITWTLQNIVPEVGDYIYSSQSEEVFRVETVGSLTLTTTRPTTAFGGITASTFYIGSYEEIQAVVAWLNDEYSATIGKCQGDTLDLNNEFVIDIEKHGDQTYSRYKQTSYPYSGISAGQNRNNLTLMYCNLNTNKSLSYPYVLNDALGPQYIRYAFNALLTNHHKILNNALRIKYDCTSYVPAFSEYAGSSLVYKNTSVVNPSKIHEFEHFLSFTDINTLLQNPAQAIEVEINGTIVKCWIKEVEFNINTKSTQFKLYESV